MSNLNETNLQVGMRIQYNGSRGFVRYIGSLEGRGDQKWVGIEWDDATRGKHAGSVNGLSYFATRHEGSGSFIKASKLANGGRTHFLAAVKQRYITDASDTSYRNEKHEVGGTGGVVEFRVRDHLLPLRKLKCVDVSCLGVAALLQPTSGDQALGDVFASMRELRVAESLFSCISVVHDLISEFKRLQVLNVSRNVLSTETSSVQKSGRTPQEQLHTLIMNQCQVVWDDVISVCSRTPNLRELRLYNCGFRSLQDPKMFSQTFSNLELLDLDMNEVPWTMVVSHLGALPRLNELYLSRNGLSDCDALQAAGAKGLNVFPRLKTLSLAQNELESWQVITGLHGLPCLRHLRLAGNKITADGEATGTDDIPQSQLTGRMNAIARIGKLEALDGSRITEDERRYAEKAYAVGACADDVRKYGIEEARKEHPRLEELCEKLGLDETVRSAQRPTGSGEYGLVKIEMRAGRNVVSGRSSVTRRMPRTVKLDRVKRIAERLLRIESSQVKNITIQVGDDAEVVQDKSRQIEFWLRMASGSEGITVICE